MKILDLIEVKKRGGALSDEMIDFFVKGVTDQSIPDYQVSALLMAIRINGMNDVETTRLTLDMAHSGGMLDLSGVNGIPVDKHSTGGVGDTTSLVLVPLVASCGAPVAKMSGRALGFTGGTLDKLDSIPGFVHGLSGREFVSILSKVGCVIAGQTTSLAPADKRLYSLRDVTGTVDSIPLIVSSILSKKLASGAHGIVLDVKTGSGALINTLDGSRELARAMVRIGKQAGRNVSALVTDMDQPLGSYIGNALEVEEAIHVLRGETKGLLLDVTLALGVQMLLASEVCGDEAQARKLLDEKLTSGAALEKFAEMVKAQHGDPRIVDDINILPQAERRVTVSARRSGYITRIRTAGIGTTSMLLGAGRTSYDDTIDLAVGLILKRRLGDYVSEGDELAEFRVNDDAGLDSIEDLFHSSITISDEKGEVPPLIHDIIN